MALKWSDKLRMTSHHDVFDDTYIVYIIYMCVCNTDYVSLIIISESL